MKTPIYLDHHATTPVDPRVLAAMEPYFREVFGNPSSRQHAFGWAAEQAVEEARQRVADLIGASPRDIVFTSGATESNNLALKGVARTYSSKGRHIVTCIAEHSSVRDPLRTLEKEGYRVTWLSVGPEGRLDPGDVQKALSKETVLVSLMAANNEIGVLAPLEEIGRLCKAAGVLFHTDAAQAAGKIPLDVETMGLDLLSLSGHKMYGPKGAGALYVRRRRPRVRLTPLLDGGGHERGLRSGTLNVPAIVGLGEAARIAQNEMEAEARRLARLRDRLERGLGDRLSGLHFNGHKADRLPGNSNISIEGVNVEALLMALPDIAVSTGSACASASLEPSHVLLALGRSPDLARSSLRFGLGRTTTEEQIDFTIQRVSEAVSKLRAGE